MPEAAKQVELTRTYDATPEQVWEAWIDPAQVSQWWGPDGFETPLDSVVIEPRPGGRYDLTMVDTRSGNSFPDRQEIVEASAPNLLVLRHEPMPEHGLFDPIVTRLEFHAHDGGTRLEVSGGPYNEAMGAIAEQGWSQQLEKLARVLSA